MSKYWTGRKRPELIGKSGVREFTEQQKIERSLSSTNKVKVLQLTKGGQFMKIWDSITDASKFLGVTRSSITNVCTGRKKSVAGYKWRYE